LISSHNNDFFCRGPFCEDAARDACRILLDNGQARDYASFCHGLAQKHAAYPTVRAIKRLELERGRPLFDPRLDPRYSGLRFFDVHVGAKSFMYKQVRRMVGVIVAAAQKRLSADEVHNLLRFPGTWNDKVPTAPPHGLYLIDIEYPNDEQLERPAVGQVASPAPGDDPSDVAIGPNF